MLKSGLNATNSTELYQISGKIQVDEARIIELFICIFYCAFIRMAGIVRGSLEVPALITSLLYSWCSVGCCYQTSLLKQERKEQNKLNKKIKKKWKICTTCGNTTEATTLIQHFIKMHQFFEAFRVQGWVFFSILIFHFFLFYIPGLW